MRMFEFRHYLFLYVSVFLFIDYAIAVEILCANSDCTEPISEARGTVPYMADKANRLSFKRGDTITIFSKSREEKHYWGAAINGNKGYVPPNLIKEMKVYKSTDKLIQVSEDIVNNTVNEVLEGFKESTILENSNERTNQPVQNVNENSNSNFNKDSKEAFIDPAASSKLSASKSFDVIEGTTIFADVNSEITPSPSATQNPNSQTVLPFPLNQNMNLKSVMENEGIQESRNPHTNEFMQPDGEHKEDAIVDDDDDGDDDDDDDVDDDDGGGGDDGDDDDNDNNDEEADVAIVKNENENNDNVNEQSKTIERQSEFVAVKGADQKKHGDILDTTMSITEQSENSGKNDEIMKDVSDAIFNSKTEELKFTVINDKPKMLSNLADNSVESKPNPNTLAPSTSEYHKDLEENIEVVNIKATSSFYNLKSVHVYENDNEMKFDINNDRQETLTHTANDEDISAPHYYLATEIPTEMKNVEVSSESYFTPGTRQVLSTLTSESASINNEAETVSEGFEKNIETTPGPVLNHITHDYQSSLPEAVTESHQEIVDVTPDNNFEVLQQKQNSVQTDVDDKNNYNNNNNEEKEKLLSLMHIETTETPSQGNPEVLDQSNPESSQNNIDIELGDVKESESSSQTSPGFFSLVTDSFNKWFDSSNSDEEKNSLVKDENIEVQTKTDHAKEFFTEYRENINPSESITKEKEEELSYWNNMFLNSIPASGNTFLYLVVTAITVLLFTLGHNFIEKKGKTAPLIAKINKLEQKLFVTSKECLLLKDELQKATDKITLYENSTNDDLINSLQQELDELKRTKSELESSIEILQQELDSATEAGLDLNKMLSEVLTQKGGSESLLESIENLQAQLNSQQRVIDDMTNKLGVKNEENEILQTALDAANEKTETLEEKLNDLKSDFDEVVKEKQTVTQDLKHQISQLQIRVDQLNQSEENELSKYKKSVEELKKRIEEASNALTVKEEECKELKNSFKQLKTKGNVNVDSLFDVCKVKAALTKVEMDKKAGLVELEKERTMKKVLEDQFKLSETEAEKLKANLKDAKQKEEEAQKKLEVLSTYFKEKETQLQKELGLKEALWAQKKGDEKTVCTLIKSLQEEVESYKSQNETLKKEIIDQERGLKYQIAGLEQKAHENWVAARQAERKLEENKQETAQLRNRLTLIEKNSASDVDGKINHRSDEVNGMEPTSPVLHDTSSPLLFPPLPLDPASSNVVPHGFMPHPMFMPPPIGGFIPPPPFLPGDRRLPPLGRMSSPPLNNQFSPPPPSDYSFDRMSSPPLSPHSRSYRTSNETEREKEHFRHKTSPYPSMYARNWEEGQEMPGFIPIPSQRDSKKEHKASSKVSSGHSSSDSLEQSNKNRARV